MKKLIIIGSSGMGKEAIWIAEEMSIYKEISVLDDSFTSLQSILNQEIIGTIEKAKNHTECDFSIAIGNPRTRKAIYSKLLFLGVSKFANLIHPRSILSPYLEIGDGNIIGPGAIISVDVKIGNFNIINNNSTIAHDSILHDFVTIAPLAAISGNVTLHDLTEVGTGATIRQGITIHQGSMLGMGSVLTKNIEESNQIFIGNPAKFFKSF